MALCKHVDGKILREYNGSTEEITKIDKSKWEINLFNKIDLIKDKDYEETDELYNPQILDSSFNEKINNEINRRLNYEYPLRHSTTLKK